MTGWADLVLVAVLGLDVYVVASSRLAGVVRASALQGVALALLPLAIWAKDDPGEVLHAWLMALGTLGLKAVLIPLLLMRSIRGAHVSAQVEPFVSLHTSAVFAAVLIGISFWLSGVLVLPHPPPSALVVPAAFATLLIGFLVLVSRRKAITQVVGYLLIENGVYIFGQSLASTIPFVVELGILLDVLVGVFVMGVAIHHIQREFEHIDTELLSTLKD